ncbi:MAG: site-specific DNA-methyltransferase [Acidobacteria bacterium]|nr:site-specific DNA-methyltransferase [Acidobacteriota bacterium]
MIAQSLKIEVLGMATAASNRQKLVAPDCVLEGDAFDLFGRVPPESVDLVITSPPYWGHREYGLSHNWELFNDIPKVRVFGDSTQGYEWYRSKGGILGLEPYPEWYVAHLVEILLRAETILKPSGSVWVNLGDTYFARWSSIRESGRQGLSDLERQRRKTPMGGFRQEKQLLLIPARFAVAMQQAGWILRNDLIWYKPNATPRPEGDRLKLSHEHFFHFVKKPKEGRPAYYYDPAYAETRTNDVVTVPAAPGEDGHTATFPKALILPRILTSSPSDGTVLDPFCGTGRALEVAKELGRKVLGFELQTNYAEAARRKIDSMAKKKDSGQAADKGNSISEWFGQRIYPVVRLDVDSVTGKKSEQCPFLTAILRQQTRCVKNENSLGVCTISSSSNGVRQDWLACPYRVIDSRIVRRSCQLIFNLSDAEINPLPASVLRDATVRADLEEQLRSGRTAYVFFQDKLGGEISVIGTPQSPEISFDVTLAELAFEKGEFRVTRYGVLELQTMDFHGSYARAVGNLRDALRLHRDGFPEALSTNLQWAGEKIEGPNIANVFKRTFYQIMVKFQLSGQGAAAGTVLALPKAVWDSWQPFLGRPEIIRGEGDVDVMKAYEGEPPSEHNAYICVFDLDAHHKDPISPVKVERFIKLSTDTLAHYAFKVVPQAMLTSIQSSDSILARIRGRLVEFWPGFIAVPRTGKRSPKA